jgi:predicted O-linked N-acetylglucosamine transferase (SPINDLY family)
MGVPVITCHGETFAGRHPLTYLANVGLMGTIAEDLAVAWANDLGRLAAVRAGSRERVARFPCVTGTASR